MPEGDAVYRTARRLDDALAGRVLVRTHFRWPSLATVSLTGATVRGTATHGKHLLTRLRHDGRELTLHTHLKMEGSWRVFAAGQKWPVPAQDVRVALRTDRTEALGVRLGLVELLPSAEEESVVGHLGPDLLAPDWGEQHEAEAVRRLLADPERPLGEALLDQTVVAGMGTIWLAETCFVTGVHPLAPVHSVADHTRMLRRARQMMKAAVQHGRPVTTGDKRDPMWVYRRHRQPCRRCSTTLVAGPVGDEGVRRTTYWCPSCQPVVGE